MISPTKNLTRTLLFLFSVVLISVFPGSVSAQDARIIRLPKPEFEFRGLKLTQKSAIKHPKVGVVFSGGGARGLAQIGVLRSLEKHNIPIQFIVGNSMGSVISGLYASGYSTAQLESIAISTNWEEVLSFTDGTKRSELFLGQKQSEELGYLTIRFDGLQPIIPSSISSGQRLTNYFMNLTLQALYHPDPSFDDLKIPYRAIAVDLVKGKRILLDHGSLAEAMRSSVTVPLLYTPLERDSMALVDGGLLTNIPVDVARDQGCEIVVAVNTTSPMRREDQLDAPWEIADQIMTIMMQGANTDQLLNADVVITPPLGDRLVSNFDNIESIIDSGEAATEEKIPQLLALIRQKEESAYTMPDSVLHNVDVEIRSVVVPDSLRLQIYSDVQNRSISLRQVENRVHLLSESGMFRDVYAEILPGPHGLDLIYHFISYPPITTIRWKGNTLVPDKDISGIMSRLQGQILNVTEIQKNLEQILRLYHQSQYSLAKIDSVKIDVETGTIDFSINEGMIIDIRCEGNTTAKDYVIRREFPLEWDDIFRLDKANLGLVNVASTGLFEYVLMDIRYEKNRPAVVLKVKEKSAELLRLGIHADNEHNIVGTIALHDANFRGAGEDLGLLFRYGFRDKLIKAEYRAYRIFRTYLTFNVKGYSDIKDIFTYRDNQTGSVARWERVEDGKYREYHLGGSFTFGSQLERFGDVTAEVRIERQKIIGISGTGYVPENYQFGSIKLQTTFDTENKFLFPTEGILFTISYENALKGLGSGISFTKFSGMYSAYHTLFRNHTLHPRILFGFADETLPLAEQFSLGGLNSFLGLQDDDTHGRQLFIGSLEYRLTLPFKIIFDTFFSARYDIGTISTVPEELKLSKFRHGLGLEIGLDTPLGAARFAAGQSFFFRRDLADSPVSVGPVLFYFSIGANL